MDIPNISRRSAVIGVIASMGGSGIANSAEQKAASGAGTPSVLPATEQLQHSTVIVRCVNAKGEASSGTGFLFALFQHNGQNVPVIVTNKHVVAGAARGVLRWTLRTAENRPDYGKFIDVEIADFEKAWIPHPDAQVDLAIFPCARMLDSLNQADKSAFLVTIDPSLVPTSAELRDLTPLEDVLIVGYPDGIFDSKNNVPVFRRGITATPAYLDFEGRKEFLIDAAIFPGSSGSPVFLFNQGSWANRNGGLTLGGRVKLLGVVYAVAQHNANGEIRIVPAPTQSRPIVVSPIPNNLGLCIEASRILEFEPVLVKNGLRPPDGYVMRAGG
jgi:hypothetical protein